MRGGEEETYNSSLAAKDKRRVDFTPQKSTTKTTRERERDLHNIEINFGSFICWISVTWRKRETVKWALQ